MNREAERRMLQGAVALACIVPLAIGALGVIRGPAMLHGVEGVPADLDSHFRYLSGLLFGLGLGFVSCIGKIERRGLRFRLLGAIVVAGGVGRLVSLADAGVPGTGHLFGLAMELGVVPLLMLWQAGLARRRSAGPGR